MLSMIASMYRWATGRFASSQSRRTVMPLLTVGILCAARSYSEWKPWASSLYELGGVSSVASIWPFSSAGHERRCLCGVDVSQVDVEAMFLEYPRLECRPHRQVGNGQNGIGDGDLGGLAAWIATGA